MNYVFAFYSSLSARMAESFISMNGEQITVLPLEVTCLAGREMVEVSV